MQCLVCNSIKVSLFETVDGVNYFECLACECLFADPEFISQLQSKESHYNEAYWANETEASRERSFGSSINRVCEVFFYSRIPIKRFVDIGSGPGYLLDALSLLAPNYQEIFYGCELFPPPPEFRTKHENYKVGNISDLDGKFSGGVCIEVIEHLSPIILEELIKQLSNVAEDGAVFFFNSAQPSFVKSVDRNYLDPFVRGHIVSYSTKSLKPIFAAYGFALIELPGRDWCFLVEYNSKGSLVDTEGLLSRLWTATPENIAILKENGFGPLMYAVGLESARCYLEHAISLERTAWAQSLL